MIERPWPAILIVDDNEPTRYLFRRMLESFTTSVEEAASGKEAIAKIATGPFDLVVTDIVMPDRDGIELIQSLKRLTPRPQILAISGSVNALPYLQTALLLGADAVLPKPVDEATFMETVARLLGEKADE